MTTSQIPWPSSSMLESAGFIRCAESGCGVFLEPKNWPHKTCKRHQHKRAQPRSRVPYIPKTRRTAA